MKIKRILIILLIIFVLFFLVQIIYKTHKNGNNIGKSTDDLVEYILNISSYEAKIEVKVNSNKTTNKYMLRQYYIEDKYARQIVEEPISIQNLEILYKDNKLEIKNTNFGITKIYENYKYINNNVLWLNSFTNNCNSDGYILEENSDEIIIRNKKEKNKMLYINKKTKLPTKLVIQDNSNRNEIYIEYKEIKLNSVQEKDIFAFKTKDIKSEV